jgi:hypothetical protein
LLENGKHSTGSEKKVEKKKHLLENGKHSTGSEKRKYLVEIECEKQCE